MKQFLPAGRIFVLKSSSGFNVKLFLFAFFMMLFTGINSQQLPASAKPVADKEQFYENISKIPVSFRENVGQWEDKILYQGSSPGWGANIYFMKDQISFGFTKEDEEEEEEEEADGFKPKMTKGKKANAKQKTASFEAYKFLVWNMHFKQGNADVQVSAEGKEDSHANYLIGDVSKHKINVPDYRMVHYKNIYDGIDARYYSTGKNLKYDFILKPGADITKIQLECEGIKHLNINEKGQLEITTKWGTLLEEIPESYQMINGEKKLVKISYKKTENTSFGFEIEGDYDNTRVLTIDPINLAWSTFVGGPGDGYISDIAVDAAGNVYGTGWYNTVFPTTAGAYQQFFQGGSGYGDAYVFKLNSTGSALVYSTYLGGTQDYEQGEGIAVNAAGQAYITGWTQSPDFPTTAGAYGTTFNYTPPNHYQNIFITKLNATGTGLVYSNLIGGIYSDYAYALELNTAGEVFVTGYSTNFMLDFPTTPGAYQSSASTSNGGVYVLKLNAAGSGLVYSTFTGNPSGRGYGLALDATDNAYVTGSNYGNMDVSAGAFQAVANANIGVYPDCFVQKINSTGTALSYSTYLGGSNWDDIYYGDGIDVDGSGNAYVFGYTQSFDFPTTPGSFDVAFSGGSDPYLTKLNPSGTALVYSTFVGQDGQGESIEVNAAGEAFVAGNVGTPGFTATACAYDASQNGGTDCFIGKINAAGTNALYLSYFGGTGNDYGNGPFGKVKLVLWGTCQDELFVCTTSHSPDFPTTAGTVQSVKMNSGADQPEVFHLKPVVTPNFTFVVNPCNNVNFTDASTGNCIWQSGAWTPSAWQWSFGDGGTSTAQNPVHTYAAAGTYSVKLVISCPKDSITIPVTVSSSGLVLSLSSTPSGCSGNTGTATVNVTTGTGPFTYTWTPVGGNAATATNLAAGNYTAAVSNGSCTSTGSVTVTSAGGSPPVTSAISGTNPVCPNVTAITYSVTNTSGSTYTWSVPAGATITSGQGTNSITVTWGSSGGTISVTETNPCGSGTPVTMNISMNSLVSTSPVSGPTPLCPNATGTTYSVTNTPGSSYAWTVPAGAAIVSGQGTNSISVNWGSTGGNVNVTETNSCGSGTPVSIAVVMNSTPSTSAISGANPVCPNAPGIVYTVTNTTGSTYNWSVPAGATITAGQGTNSVTVNWGATGGTLSVTETNVCGAGLPVSINVTISSTPVTSAITGSSPVCPNATGVIYSVVNTTGSTYSWSVPLGATITAGQGTSSITVDWGATGGTISVTETSTCGTGAPVTTTVVVSSTPVTSAITGTTPVCPNATATTYSVTNTGSSTYAWTIPVGATVTSGQGTNFIVVDWGTAGGTVSVTETSACGSGSPVTFTVVMNSLPATSAITGTTPVCPNATGITYSVTNTAGSTYTWVVPAGATITAGQGTNTITVNWASTGGNVSVTETNSCGSGTAVSMNVVISSTPVTSAITGASPVCPNATGIIYSVTNTAGSTYNWIVPGGASITAGQGTNSITVNWSATGGTISCTETSACGNGTPVTINVTIGTTPSTSAITGTSPVCPNATLTSYSVTNTTGSTYAWTVPTGATITAGQGTNSITVTWGSTGGNVSVTESSTCGTGTPVTVAVTMNSAPVTTPINGTTPVCPNATNVIYSTNNTTGSTYSWTVPAGATIVSGQGNNAIIVNWGTNPGTVSVTETNACGTGTAVTYPVTLFPLPSTSPITGGNPSCANTNGVAYTVTNTPGSTYNWTVTGGGTIVSGQGTNSMTLNWGATGGTVTCTETNSCGPGAPVSVNVTFSTIPITSTITGISPVCPNQLTTLYTVNGNAGSTYSWIVPAGASIVSGTNSNTITVNWGTTGGTITCAESNICGTGATQNYNVVMNANPATGAVTGVSPICPNTTAVVFSVPLTTGSTYNWTVPLGAVITSGQGSNTIVVNWGSGGGNVSITETNSCASGAPVNFPVSISPSPIVQFSASSHQGCSPLSVNFTDNSLTNGGATITSWSWIFGDGNTSSLQNPSNTYTSPGAYNITLTVTSGAGCTLSYTAGNLVNVFPNPTADFTTAEPFVTITDPTVNFIDLSQSNIASWSWNFGDNGISSQQSPSHFYNDAGMYDVLLTVTNQYGCMDDITKTVEVKDEFTFYIPNAFTPNGDGHNDAFRGEGRGIGKYEMSIFDRWGDLIYKTNEYDKPWNGIAKKGQDEVQEDVYIYKIVVNEESGGKEHKYIGQVSIVR